MIPHRPSGVCTQNSCSTEEGSTKCSCWGEELGRRLREPKPQLILRDCWRLISLIVDVNSGGGFITDIHIHSRVKKKIYWSSLPPKITPKSTRVDPKKKKNRKCSCREWGNESFQPQLIKKISVAFFSFSFVFLFVCFTFSPPLPSRFLKREQRETEEEETMPQMMNPPLDCILSGWVRPVGQSQVLESS